MSQLLGTLTAGKNGSVYLINPNGILVGGGARIDAGSLVLSTLDATDDQLLSIYKTDLPNLTLTSKKDSDGLNIKSGADIKVGTFLGLLGNKVQIADNVTISDVPYNKDDTDFVVAAAKNVVLKLANGNPADITSVTTEQGNTVDIKAAKFNISNEYPDTYILGNDIKMTETDLNINSRNPKASSTSLDIIASDNFQWSKENPENVELRINRGNHLDLSGVTASADYMHVIGGRTSIDNSKLELTATTDEFKQGEPAPYMTIAALRGDHLILDDIEGGVQHVLNAQDEKNPAVANSLTIKNSDLTSKENLSLWGGSVELVNTNLKTATETNDKDNNIDIYAFESVDNDGAALTNSSNTVKVTGGSIESGADISMRGAKIAIDGVDKIAGTGEKSAVEFLAGKTIWEEDEPDTIEINGTENNTIDIKNTNITSNDGTLAYGGAVNIASSSLKDNNSSIQIAAANYYLDDDTLYTDGKDSGEPRFLASTNNGVTLDNAQLTTSAKGPDGVNAIGIMSGNVTVKNKSTLDSGDIWLTAGKSYEDKNTTEVLSADSGMNLTVSDSTLKASEDATLVGANVGLTNTSLTVGTEGQDTTGTNGIVRLAAGQDVTLYDQDDRGFGIESANNTGDVSLNNVTMNALGEVDAYGKTIDIKDSNLTGNSTIAFSAGNATEDGVSSTVENTINLANTTVNTNDAGLALIGGKVNVTDKSNLTVGDLELVAGTSYTNDGNAIQGADATNLSISDSTMTAKHDATLIGANVDLKKTTLNVGTPNDIEFKANGAVRIAAAKDVKLEEDGQKGSVITEVNNTGNLTMTGTTLSTQGDVKAYGETVKLQDSALSTTNDKELNFNALNTYKRVNGTSDTWTATKDNTMDVTGTTLTNKGIIELSSGKLTMDKSNLTATGKEGAILVDARASYTDDDKGPYVNKATDGMDVNIKDSNFSGDNGVLVVGNTVTIDGQSSAKSANAKVFFATGQQSEMTDTSIKGNGAPVNVGKDVKYDAKNTEFAPGMKTIETKPTEPTKPDQPTTPTEPTEPTEPTKPDQPTTPTKPTNPDKPIVTPDPKPAVDVKKNIEQGKQDMTKAIADNKDNVSAAVKQQAEKLSDSKMTDEEKAAQVKGYAEAIEDSQASAEEKQALVKDTVKSFEPTQQSSIEAQNKQDESAQNSNAQTVIPDVTVKTVAPAAHEDAAATVTVDGTVVNE